MSEIGKVFMFGFTEKVISKERLEFFKKAHVSNFILFRENIEKIKENIEILRNEFDNPLIAVDQEGGIVRRFKESDSFFFGNMNASMSNDPNYIKDIYREIGNILQENGINLNLAPVVDVYLKKGNSIGIRSFGSDPKTVSLLGSKAIEGLHEANVLATLKHFIGYGAATLDPHIGLPIFEGSKKMFDDALIPFFENAKKTDFIMSAHIIVPFLDEKLPITFSKNALNFLRSVFEGPIISDCLEMGGAMIFREDEIAVKALEAQNDLLIVSHTFEIQKKLFESVEKSKIDVSEKIKRIENVKKKLKNKKIGRKEIKEKYVTVFKNKGFIPKEKNTLRILSPTIMQEVLVEEIETSIGDFPLDLDSNTIEEISNFKEKNAVLISYNAFKHKGIVTLGKKIKEIGHNLCVIIAGDPADLPLFDFADCIVLTLSPLKEIINFAIGVIEGKFEAKGTLPVSVDILWKD